MQNAKRVQTIPELFGKHRCPIVGEEVGASHAAYALG
jgi:hypothetical protein